MTAIVKALLNGEPVPVAVVKDQQDIAHENDKRMSEPCPDCGELPCNCHDD